jgi:long-subunit fatty acid transport protein
MKLKYIKLTLVIILLTVTYESGNTGPRGRLGTSAAPELLIPLGSVGTSLQGSNIAYVTGIDAMYWNPAGLSQLSTNTGEAIFSHMNYIADINMQYFAGAVKVGNLGVVGASIRSLNIGEEIVTTEFFPEGTGQTFSPTYLVLNLSFARAMTDKIHFGTNVKLISESIAEVSATGFAFDFGLQYIAGKSGLRFGIALKNLGPSMRFDGSGFDAPFIVNGQEVIRRVTLQDFELPTNLEIGLSYSATFSNNNHVSLSTAFLNSSYSSDEYRFGLQYDYNRNFFLRGAVNILPDKEEDEALFGPTFGAGLRYPFGNVTLGFDYAYRMITEDGFDSTNQFFTLLVGF